MLYVLFECGLEDQQRELKCKNSSRPSPMFRAIVLVSLNENRFWRCDALLFPSALGPIRQELCLALVGQRMIEQLVNHLERHSRDISAESCSFNDVNRMTQARGENFSLPAVVLIDLDDLL